MVLYTILQGISLWCAKDRRFGSNICSLRTRYVCNELATIASASARIVHLSSSGMCSVSCVVTRRGDRRLALTRMVNGGVAHGCHRPGGSRPAPTSRRGPFCLLTIKNTAVPHGERSSWYHAGMCGCGCRCPAPCPFHNQPPPPSHDSRLTTRVHSAARQIVVARSREGRAPE